jgi:lysine/ornithine N-monooxygenase
MPDFRAVRRPALCRLDVLDVGTGPVSLALAVIIVGFVGHLTVTRKDTAR